MKDWLGNKATTFVQLGASNHSEKDREVNDYYATDPHSLKIFLKALKRDGVELHQNIWECACGEGHLSKVLKDERYNVYSSDLIDRGYTNNLIDFLEVQDKNLKTDILTNPPYKYAQDFVAQALQVIEGGYYVIMFLKIQFLEGQKRQELFKQKNLKYVYVNSCRQTCYINGDMSKKMSSASCYCWYIWQKGYEGEPIIRWI